MSRRVSGWLAAAVVSVLGVPVLAVTDEACTTCYRQLSAGYRHSCAVRADGTVACWGSNESGQSAPLAGTFRQVSAGGYHTCGVRSDGTVACWGEDVYGQSSPPTGTFQQVAAGWQYTCGVRTEGTLACWGIDFQGQLAEPEGTFQQVGTSWHTSCAVRTDGTVACWGGFNEHGERTPPDGTFLQVATGFYHSCGVRTGGTVACWGANDAGVSTPPAGTFEHVGAGAYYNCGLRTAGTVACWGDNYSGQSEPPPGTFQQVGVGFYHACGLGIGGDVSCWGSDLWGQSWPLAGFCGLFRDDLELGGNCRWANGSTPCWSADCDGDGFAAPNAPSYCLAAAPGVPAECPAGTWTNVSPACRAFDCLDENAAVRAGQASFFTAGYNRQGGGLFRYDYNCDGVEEKLYPTISAGGLCCYENPQGWCVQGIGPGCAASGWDPATVLEAPACGAGGLYLRCGWDGSVCTEIAVTETQGCR